MMRLLLGLLTILIGLAAGAFVMARDKSDEVSLYDPNVDAGELIRETLAQAQAEDKLVLLIFGANWCHDSRGLARHLNEDERLSTFLADHYKIARIDIGVRHRNLDQVNLFGIETVYGTPTLIITNHDGQAINGLTAHDWRTADNASTADILAYLSHYAEARYAPESIASVDLNAAMQTWTPYQIAYLDIQDQLTKGETNPEEAAVEMNYIAGFARSIARQEMGRFSNRNDRDIASRFDLNSLNIEPSEDLTPLIIERMAERTPDLLARRRRDLEKTRQAFQDEKSDDK